MKLEQPVRTPIGSRSPAGLYPTLTYRDGSYIDLTLEIVPYTIRQPVIRRAAGW